jgi:signal transduction histidine kinase
MTPAVIALALLALLEAQARGEQRELAILLALPATLPLLFARRRLLVATALVGCATVFAFLSPEVPKTVAGLAGQAWVLYLLAERYRGRVAVLAGVLLVLVLAFAPGSDWARAVLLVLGLGGLALGHSRRLRGEVSAARDDQAVLEERARIARELHDVVAHHVSAIAVQADTGRLTGDAAQFEAIGDTAREAMTEMRRVLGVLRGPAGERAPQPGLADLRALLDGVPLETEGTPVPLSPGVDLTAYRIVQEALTNARRHAPGATVKVRLAYTPGAVTVLVRDDGPGAGGPEGHGLRGMRERVAMVGGSLALRNEDGFVVEAVLPA